MGAQEAERPAGAPRPTPPGVPASAPLSVSPSEVFAVGDPVEAHHSDGRWLAATVKERAGGNYLLDWDNGDPQQRVKRSSEMRRAERLAEAPRPAPHSDLPSKAFTAVGGRAEAHNSDSRWHAATVKEAPPQLPAPSLGSPPSRGPAAAQAEPPACPGGPGWPSLDGFQQSASPGTCPRAGSPSSSSSGGACALAQDQALLVGRREDAVTSLTSHFVTLREQLQDALTEGEAYKSLASKQEQDMLSLRADRDAKEQSLTSELDTLREQLRDAVTASEAHKSLVSKQEQDMLSLRADWDAKEQSLTSELDTLRAQLHLAATECEARTNVVPQQEQQMLSLQADWDAKEHSLTSELDMLREQLRGAVTEGEAYKNLASKQEQDMLSLQADRDAKEQSLTSELDTLREQLRGAVTEREAYKSLVSKQQDMLPLQADWDAKEQSLTSQLDTLRAQLHLAATECEKYKNLAPQQERQMLSLQADWDAKEQSLTSELDMLREQLHDAVTEGEGYKSLVSKKEQDILSLQADWDAKEHLMTSAQRRTELIAEMISERCKILEAALSNSHRKQADLSIEMGARKGSADKLQRELIVGPQRLTSNMAIHDIASTSSRAHSRAGSLGASSRIVTSSVRVQSSMPPLDQAMSARSDFPTPMTAQTSPLRGRRPMSARSGYSTPRAAHQGAPWVPSGGASLLRDPRRRIEQ